MTDRRIPAHAAGTIAAGFLLLHVNFNLGTLNILPDWLGYLLILRALPSLEQGVPSAGLLKPLGTGLTVWEGIRWVIAIFGGNVNAVWAEVIGLAQLVAAVAALYFSFQLFTNLAELAQQYGCPEQKRLLTLRTWRTIGLTLAVIPFPWEEYIAAAVVFVAANLVVAIWICAVLFSLKNSLLREEEEG